MSCTKKSKRLLSMKTGELVESARTESSIIARTNEHPDFGKTFDVLTEVIDEIGLTPMLPINVKSEQFRAACSRVYTITSNVYDRKVGKTSQLTSGNNSVHAIEG